LPRIALAIQPAGSNTRNLIENVAFNGVFIEGNARRFKDLLKEFEHHKRVTPIQRYVNFEGPDRLDAILQPQVPNLPTDFDLLSIDIDGNNYPTELETDGDQS